LTSAVEVELVGVDAGLLAAALLLELLELPHAAKSSEATTAGMTKKLFLRTVTLLTGNGFAFGNWFAFAPRQCLKTTAARNSFPPHSAPPGFAASSARAGRLIAR
jgi:hypothetical protein